ncbi:MAG TPA: hypothetical protein VM577_20755, partial [Anaerovoracaceae bacterium]|nr:hypothetical protein [Anaerovoracaceae bacterium]
MFERSIRPMLNNILYSLTGKWAEFRIEYGILALVASIAVPLKLLLFYNLIGVTANFFFVWLITGILTYFLFASFKNKWIPAAIYLLLSILMFCDVTYSSFFNRYLSVNMLGAAGFLGDITASIKEVLKPWFYLILADAVLILAALTVRQLKLRKTAAAVGENNETAIEEDSETTVDADAGTDSDVNTEKDKDKDTDTEIIAEAAAEEAVMIAEDADAITENTFSSNREARKARRERKKRFMEWVSGHKKPVTAL